MRAEQACTVLSAESTVAHSCHVKEIISKFRDNKSKFPDSYLKISR